MVNKYSAKLSGLKRTKWDNKTPKQQAQYFMKVYQELGLNIPKYLLDGKMTTKQLESNINKLTRSLQSRAKKETKRLRQERETDKKVKQAVEKRNTETIKVLDDLIRKYDLSENMVNYLMGYGVDFGRNKVNFLQGLTLGLVNYDNLSFKDINAKKDFIKLMEKSLTDIKDIEKILTNDKESNKWFDDFLDGEYLQSLSEKDKGRMKEVFNTLSPFHKRIIIEDFLNQMKEKYEDMVDDEESISYEMIGDKVFNNFMIMVDYYKKI